MVAYRLKELDSNWVYTNNRNVDFNFLQAGTYTFELKACNNNNVDQSAPAICIYYSSTPLANMVVQGNTIISDNGCHLCYFQNTDAKF
ncbi:MAG: hypothetical protein IPK57_17625 [Chitinophagaceae bacterium]|nr:hypothetical protein [Chitinophagaceae bacterium]